MKSNIAANENQSSYFPHIISVVKNVLISYVLTLLCLLVFAFIITFTNFPDSFVPAIVLILTIFSVMLSGILVARRSSSRGWLSGAVSGIVYMITLYILGAIVFNDVSFGINVLAMLALGLFAGTFGGIIGINMKHRK